MLSSSRRNSSLLCIPVPQQRAWNQISSTHWKTCVAIGHIYWRWPPWSMAPFVHRLRPIHWLADACHRTASCPLAGLCCVLQPPLISCAL